MTPDLTIHALGTQVRASGKGAFEALREVTRLESLLTRFRPSPLTALNERGELQTPPADLLAAVQYALNVARDTRGLVTPTVLSALEAAGYTTAPGAGTVQAPVIVPDTSDISLTPERIRLPAGVRLDLGGTAKSWMAERAAAHLQGNYLLDAGGDLIVQSTRPVTIGIETPGAPAYLNLNAGMHGVATSSTLKRAWVGGHHLIDPRTGASARTPFVQVTAVTRRVTDAEVLTKLALLNAQDVLHEWLQRLPDAQLLAFDHLGQGTVLTGGQWKRWAA